MSDIPPLSLSFPTFVVEYAFVDESIKYHDRKNLWAGGEWLGAVPKLAISFNPRTREYLLSHCDEEWDELCNVESRKTIEEIKALAERRYEGIGENWIATDYSEAEAEQHFHAVTSEWRCSFCNKSPYDEENRCNGGFAVSDNAKICYACIKSFAEDLAKNDA